MGPGVAKRDLAKRHLTASCAAAALASGAWTSNAQAQAVQGQPNASPAAANTIGEVVVTAERRVQRLQDVPISATVLSGAELAQKGVSNIADVQQVSPSIAINQNNRSTYVNIRGVGLAQASPTSSPGVAYYIDGLLIPHEQFIATSFYDIGSIEVLRGPQGTLTGQNSTGGALYVRTPDPKFGQISGYVDQTVGDYSWFRTMAAANLSINDNVALRVAGARETRNSYTRNIGNVDNQPGNTDFTAGRVNLALRTSDGAYRFNLRGEYFDNNTDNVAIKRRNDPVSADPFVIEQDADSYLRQHGYRISGEFRAKVTSGVDIRVLNSWQDGTGIDLADGDRTSTAPPRPPTTNVGRVGYTNTRFKTLVNEMNLVSTDPGPLKWVVGAFFLNENVPASVLRDNNNTVAFVSSTSTITTEAINTSRSVFGQVNYFVTPKLELLAGGRESWDSQTYNRIVSVGGVGATTVSSAEPTGKVGATYHLERDTLLYATASRGYKAGGGNLTLSAASYGPETNTVYEGGIKTTAFDHSLRLNGDVFYSDYANIQLASLANGLPLTQNAASGKAWGAELEATGRAGGLDFNGGVGYLDAEFGADSLLQNTVTNANQVAHKGDVLPFSPKWTINAGVQYEFLLAGAKVTPRVQWSHVSDSLATPFASAATQIPGHEVTDVRVTFSPTDRLRIEAFANNVFNKIYIANQLQNTSTADGGIVYGAPRQIGGRLTLNF